MVPIKGTFEFDIAHRFGVVKNGISDFWGLFAPSNIRFGVSYVPIENLNVGMGLTKDRMNVDGSLKYSILKQTKDSWAIPISVTYYGNYSYDAVEDPTANIFFHNTDRWRYFNQIIFARKVSEKLSVQAAASISHQNFVQGYVNQVDSITKEVAPEMKHDHFALSFAGRFKITESIALIANYDQPLTKHTLNNPNPNVAFGLDMGTSGHSFQFYVGNYSALNPQKNNIFNKNNPFTYTNVKGETVKGGNFVIGFTITRLWNL